MATRNFLITLLALLAFIVLAVFAIQGIMGVLRTPSAVIYGAKCEPPCWRGISPGEGDPYRISELLAAMQDVDSGSVNFESDAQDQINKIYWNFQLPSPDSTGAIYFEDKKVSALSFLTVGSLKLGDLFKRLGEPQSYWTEIGHREYNDYLRVYLLYPEQGCVADVLIDFAGGDKQVAVKESTPVFQVTFFDPAKFEELLQSRILIDKPPNARTGRAVPWAGYGAISINPN